MLIGHSLRVGDTRRRNKYTNGVEYLYTANKKLTGVEKVVTWRARVHVESESQLIFVNENVRRFLELLNKKRATRETINFNCRERNVKNIKRSQTLQSVYYNSNLIIFKFYANIFNVCVCVIIHRVQFSVQRLFNSSRQQLQSLIFNPLHGLETTILCYITCTLRNLIDFKITYYTTII